MFRFNLLKKKILPSKWEVLINQWCAEGGVNRKEITVVLCKEKEIEGYVRATAYVATQEIHLAIGSNNIEESKFCFLHELGHLIEFKAGRIDLATYALRHSHWLESEHVAHKFALDHGGKPTEYILKCFEACSFPYEEEGK